MAALLFLAAAAALLAAQAPSLTHWDAAELLVVGAGLDIGHPPSYPLHACLTRLALDLPAGGWMVRAGLVSVVPAALAIALLPGLARTLGGSPRASWVAAALALLCPLVWEQAATVEKHGLHLALAVGFARVALDPAIAVPRIAFAFGAALAHHPLTLMLFPLLLPAGLRVRDAAKPARALLVAVALVALPLSLRPLYLAVRAGALAADPAAANWGNADRFGGWRDHLLVRQYSDTLTFRPGQDRPPLTRHARVYPEALGWAGTACGLLGLGLLARRRRRLAVAVAGAIVATILFRIRFASPASITGTYHLQAILLLAALAPAGVGAIRRVRFGGPAAALLIALLTGEGVFRLAAFQPDASRALGIHDVYMAELAATPPGAVRLSASILDYFAIPALQLGHGLRPDLPVIQLPAATPAGWFIVRDWTGRTLHRLPNARVPEAEPGAHPAALMRALLDANPARCFVLGAYAGFAALPDRFVTDGPVFRPSRSGSPCAARPAGRSARVLRRLPSRGWIGGSPAGANRFGAPHLAVFMMAAASRLDQALLPEEALRCRVVATRLAPDAPDTWLALAASQSALGRPFEAQRSLDRALAADPGSPLVLARRLDAWIVRGDQRALRDELGRAFRAGDMARTPGAAAVRDAIARGDLPLALDAARPLIARRAVELAGALPDHATTLPRRITLLKFARFLTPDDPVIDDALNAARQKFGVAQ